MTELANLVLQDGTVYEGESFGGAAASYGEVVFTTSMTGYQEMLTDPSFAGQIVVPTYPLQGNYGINVGDVESRQIQVAGFVVRGHSPTPSHALSERTLHSYLASQDIPGISGIDTRALTRRLRVHGVMMGAIAVGISPQEALAQLQRGPQYGTTDFVKQVTADSAYLWEGIAKSVNFDKKLGVRKRIVVPEAPHSSGRSGIAKAPPVPRTSSSDSSAWIPTPSRPSPSRMARVSSLSSQPEIRLSPGARAAHTKARLVRLREPGSSTVQSGDAMGDRASSDIEAEGSTPLTL